MRYLVALALFLAAAGADAQDTYVNGYFKSDGTYVQPHYRSAPDNNPYNNWSTQPNINPYTGQQGTQNPWGAPSGTYKPYQPYQPYQPYKQPSYGTYGN